MARHNDVVTVVSPQPCSGSGSRPRGSSTALQRRRDGGDGDGDDGGGGRHGQAHPDPVHHLVLHIAVPEAAQAEREYWEPHLDGLRAEEGGGELTQHTRGSDRGDRKRTPPAVAPVPPPPPPTATAAQAHSARRACELVLRGLLEGGGWGARHGHRGDDRRALETPHTPDAGLLARVGRAQVRSGRGSHVWSARAGMTAAAMIHGLIGWTMDSSDEWAGPKSRHAARRRPREHFLPRRTTAIQSESLQYIFPSAPDHYR